MSKTITVLSGKWITTKEAATALNRDIRTLQKLAARGDLKWKKAQGTNARLYDAEDLERYMKGEAPKPDRSSNAVVPIPKSERALDMVSIVGQIMSAIQAPQQIAEAAEQERRKFEREDARQRFEAEQRRLATEQAQRVEAERIMAERALPWITLETAGAISGRTRANLLELCRNGKIVAEKAGGWRIFRRSLEALDENATVGPVGLRKAASAK